MKIRSKEEILREYTKKTPRKATRKIYLKGKSGIEREWDRQRRIKMEVLLDMRQIQAERNQIQMEILKEMQRMRAGM